MRHCSRSRRSCSAGWPGGGWAPASAITAAACSSRRHRPKAVAVTAAVVLAAVSGDHPGRAARDGLIVLLATAMGVQNAVARRLAVPDLTTTVLTLTLTGVAADSKLAGGSGSKPGRRLLAVSAMLLGALAGGLLVLRVSIAAPLAAAALVLAGVAATTHRLAGAGAPWANVTKGAG